MKTMLKALQWQRGPDRWVLKSPLHSEYLDLLLGTFPDATIVVTHRDPVAVVQSLATMWAYLVRLWYREVDTKYIGDQVVQHVDIWLRGIVRHWNLIPDDRRIDVIFHEFMDDKFGNVERIYHSVGLDLTQQQRERMRSFLEEHPRGKHGRVSYDLRGDFGLDPRELRMKFEFYCKRFPVKIEVR